MITNILNKGRGISIPDTRDMINDDNLDIDMENIDMENIDMENIDMENSGLKVFMEEEFGNNI